MPAGKTAGTPFRHRSRALAYATAKTRLRSRAASRAHFVRRRYAGPPVPLRLMARGPIAPRLREYSAAALHPAAGAQSLALAKAASLAKALGVAEPTMPGKDDHPEQAIRAELLANKTPKIADSFELGFDLTNAWFGAMLGVNVDRQVAQLEQRAKKTGIPESVWRADYDKLKGKPTAAALEAFAKNLEAYLKG